MGSTAGIGMLIGAISGDKIAKGIDDLAINTFG